MKWSLYKQTNKSGYIKQCKLVVIIENGLILRNTSMFTQKWCTLAGKIDNMHWQCRSPLGTLHCSIKANLEIPNNLWNSRQRPPITLEFELCTLLAEECGEIPGIWKEQQPRHPHFVGWPFDQSKIQYENHAKR